MRRILVLAAVAVLTCSNAGCFINFWSADPNERMEQLIFQSENLRQIKKEWARFWLVDQPSHMTYDRVHGGLGPS
jgi:hypothetical protein